jgi:lysophospholipase L1-like esterase
MTAMFASAKNMQPQTNPKRQTKVALIGDSITELSIYPTHLAYLLGSAYIVGNFGVCGTTITLDSASPYIYTEAIKASKKYEPDSVVIMLGTNDADKPILQANFLADYSTLIEQFSSLENKPNIYLVLPPPIFSSWGGLSGEVLAKEIIPAIERIAKTNNRTLIDVFSILKNSSYFFDGVHPNDLGGKVIAEAVHRVLTMN